MAKHEIDYAEYQSDSRSMAEMKAAGESSGHWSDSSRAKSTMYILNIVVGAVGVASLFIVTQQTIIATSSLKSQLFMNSLEILYSEMISPIPKLLALNEIAKTEDVISGFSARCESYRLCFDFEDLRLVDIVVGDAVISGFRLYNNIFERATLERVSFENSVLYVGNMNDVLVIDSNFSGVNFSSERLQDVYFTNTNLEGSDFSYGKFFNVMFPGSNLSDVILCGSSESCAVGLTSESVGSSFYYRGRPPIGAAWNPELESATIWQCEPGTSFADSEETCMRVRISRARGAR